MQTAFKVFVAASVPVVLVGCATEVGREPGGEVAKEREGSRPVTHDVGPTSRPDAAPLPLDPSQVGRFDGVRG